MKRFRHHHHLYGVYKAQYNRSSTPGDFYFSSCVRIFNDDTTQSFLIKYEDFLFDQLNRRRGNNTRARTCSSEGGPPPPLSQRSEWRALLDRFDGARALGLRILSATCARKRWNGEEFLRYQLDARISIFFLIWVCLSVAGSFRLIRKGMELGHMWSEFQKGNVVMRRKWCDFL